MSLDYESLGIDDAGDPDYNALGVDPPSSVDYAALGVDPPKASSDGFFTKTWKSMKDAVKKEGKRWSDTPLKAAGETALDLAKINPISLGQDMAGGIVKTTGDSLRWLRNSTTRGVLNSHTGGSNESPEVQELRKAGKFDVFKEATPDEIQTEGDVKQVLTMGGMPPWLRDAPELLIKKGKEVSAPAAFSDSLVGKTLDLGRGAAEFMAPGMLLKAAGKLPAIVKAGTALQGGLKGGTSRYSSVVDAQPDTNLDTAEKAAAADTVVQGALAYAPLTKFGEGVSRNVVRAAPAAAEWLTAKAFPSVSATIGKTLPWLDKAVVPTAKIVGSAAGEAGIFGVLNKQVDKAADQNPEKGYLDHILEAVPTVLAGKALGGMVNTSEAQIKANARNRVLDPTYGDAPLIPVPQLRPGANPTREMVAVLNGHKEAAASEALMAHDTFAHPDSPGYIAPAVRAEVQLKLEQINKNQFAVDHGMPMPHPEVGVVMAPSGDPLVDHYVKVTQRAMADSKEAIRAQDQMNGGTTDERAVSSRLIQNYNDNNPQLGEGGRTTGQHEKGAQIFDFTNPETGESVTGKVNSSGSRVASGEGNVSLVRTTLNKAIAPFIEAHKAAHQELMDRWGGLADKLWGTHTKDATKAAERSGKLLDSLEADRDALEQIYKDQGIESPQGSPEYQISRKMAQQTAASLVNQRNADVVELQRKLDNLKTAGSREANPLEPDAYDPDVDPAHLKAAHKDAQIRLQEALSLQEQFSKLKGLPTEADVTAHEQRVSPEEIALHEALINAAYHDHQRNVRDLAAATGIQGKLLAGRAAREGLTIDPKAQSALEKINAAAEKMGNTAEQFSSVPHDMWVDAKAKGDPTFLYRAPSTTQNAARFTGHEYVTDPLLTNLHAALSTSAAHGNALHQETIAKLYGKEASDFIGIDAKKEGYQQIVSGTDMARRWPDLVGKFFPDDIANWMRDRSPSHNMVKGEADPGFFEKFNNFMIKRGFQIGAGGHLKNEIPHQMMNAAVNPFTYMKNLAESSQALENYQGGDADPRALSGLRAGLHRVSGDSPTRKFYELTGGADPATLDAEMTAGQKYSTPSGDQWTWRPHNTMMLAGARNIGEQKYKLSWEKLSQDQRAESFAEAGRAAPDYYHGLHDSPTSDFFHSKGMRVMSNFNTYADQKIKGLTNLLADAANNNPNAAKQIAAIGGMEAIRRMLLTPAVQVATGNDDVEASLGGMFPLIREAGHVLSGDNGVPMAVANAAREAFHPTAFLNAFNAAEGNVSAFHGGKAAFNPADQRTIVDKWQSGDKQGAAKTAAEQMAAYGSAMGQATMFTATPWVRLANSEDPADWESVISAWMRSNGMMRTTPVPLEDSDMRTNKKHRTVPRPLD